MKDDYVICTICGTNFVPKKNKPLKCPGCGITEKSFNKKKRKK